MRKILFAALTFASISLGATNTNPVNEVESKNIKTDVSTIQWTGKKVTGSHTGTINIKSGSLEFDNGNLTGGNIVIDMNTIVCTDLSGGGAKKLVGHLKSDDFFGVADHPTAELNITKVDMNKDAGTYEITADITIKGKTKSISFPASIGTAEASSTVTIDRTDFDIRYGSGSFFDNLGDKTIYDDFELVINLQY